ncbi:hypothetical protein [Streptomyces sp. Je 1-369]|uniref:hypothetical protein n=1 Tax=Streptomyces sp. Je 1-369 TaxID=2966192 RepID=UPI002286A7F4|nr:hypothetical protein [Streptomyces sp. Je 1-369]WAM00565.1 hypothetical protein NOO62_07040 [Streptomyces sp. Je 1-369]
MHQQPMQQQPPHQQPAPQYPAPQHHQQPLRQQPHQAYSPQYQQTHAPAPYQQQPRIPDPPIYRTLIRQWADRGRTLPGHHDAEWVRLVAPPVRHGQFSASRDPRGDVR